MKETPCMYIFMCSQIELSTFVGILQQTSLPYIHSINFIIFQWFIRKFCDFKIVESEDSTRACILTTTYAKIPINKQKNVSRIFHVLSVLKISRKTIQPFSRNRSSYGSLSYQLLFGLQVFKIIPKRLMTFICAYEGTIATQRRDGEPTGSNERPNRVV